MSGRDPDQAIQDEFLSDRVEKRDDRFGRIVLRVDAHLVERLRTRCSWSLRTVLDAFTYCLRMRGRFAARVRFSNQILPQPRSTSVLIASCISSSHPAKKEPSAL